MSRAPSDRPLAEDGCTLSKLRGENHTRLALLGGRLHAVARGYGMRPKMARYLFIVSLRHRALYDLLRAQFADDANAQVILDRRRGERRQAEISIVLERRRADRRQRPDVSEELRRRSVAVVTIP